MSVITVISMNDRLLLCGFFLQTNAPPHNLFVQIRTCITGARRVWVELFLLHSPFVNGHSWPDIVIHYTGSSPSQFIRISSVISLSLVTSEIYEHRSIKNMWKGNWKKVILPEPLYIHASLYTLHEYFLYTRTIYCHWFVMNDVNDERCERWSN